jgi:hypothetical protein
MPIALLPLAIGALLAAAGLCVAVFSALSARNGGERTPPAHVAAPE